ncbi:anthranilate phosphoribosyltransferase [Nonomuraea sp. NPDC050556]|uniref:anthranilate phosphoribosyltransferase n=1 Tax=Nonomuraea sp. NPDC050556 TaxID=3364369 RepID=UPI0037B7F97B
MPPGPFTRPAPSAQPASDVPSTSEGVDGCQGASTSTGPARAGSLEGTFAAILEGRRTKEQMAAALREMHRRGETAAEVEACVRAMLRRAVRLDPGYAVVDIGGTGGDRAGTFNISTVAALVVAACGVPVIKHGNRAVTGRCGSLDLLEALGVEIPPADRVVAQLDRYGFAVAATPLVHRFPAELNEVRRSLGFPSIFNLAGPIAHPAVELSGQIVGVGWLDALPAVTGALTRLGRTQVSVVHGAGTDEPTLTGPTLLYGRDGIRQITAGEYGLAQADTAALRGGAPAVNAAICRSVLTGEPGPRRDVVLLCAGLALWTAQVAPSVHEGIQRAAAAIDEGAARALLERLTTRQIRPLTPRGDPREGAALPRGDPPEGATAPRGDPSEGAVTPLSDGARSPQARQGSRSGVVMPWRGLLGGLVVPRRETRAARVPGRELGVVRASRQGFGGMGEVVPPSAAVGGVTGPGRAPLDGLRDTRCRLEIM